MIFVTVGEQTPFDRLVRAVDGWAGEHGRRDVLAQIGASGYRPRHIEAVRFLPPAEFAARFRAAELVIAHAGTGSIFTAMELRKPILVMPRRAVLGETRNEHQLATARRFADLGIPVAWDERELVARLGRLDGLAAAPPIVPHAPPGLIAAIRGFILAAPDRPPAPSPAPDLAARA